MNPKNQREKLRRKQAAGYVLAGGASSRMGRNKALLLFGGEPLVVHMARLVAATGIGVTVVGRPEEYEPFGVKAIADDEPGLGPLGGIATALAHSSRAWNLIVAVDLPRVTTEWLAALVDRALDCDAADAVLPRSERGLEPLCGVYHRRCLEPIRAALGRGVRKVTSGLAGPPACRVAEIPPGEWNRFAAEGRLLENVNTPREYERAVADEQR
jgi:molybdopterin-guanine dinucleotide biosynthesis protein A